MATPSAATSSTGSGKPSNTKGKPSGKDSTNRYRNKRTNPIPTPQPKFEGRCSDLTGFIFDCSDNTQADRFTKVTREISEYVLKEYSYGSDLHISILDLEETTIPEPDDPDPGASETQKAIWRERVKKYVARTEFLEENIKSLYSLVLGQCTDIMRQKIEADPDFDDYSKERDGLSLLVTIKKICFNFQSQKYSPQSIHEAMRKFYSTYQGQRTTNQEYYEKFKNAVEVVDHVGGFLETSTTINKQAAKDLGYNYAAATPAQLEEIHDKARDMYLAVAFLLGADRRRYGKVIQSFENGYTQGSTKWPTTLQQAFNVLVHWRHDQVKPANANANTGVAFTGMGDLLPEDNTSLTTTGKRDRSTVTCFRCGAKGHYANDKNCPKVIEQAKKAEAMETSEGVQLLMDAANWDDLPGGNKFCFQTTGIISDKIVQHASTIPNTWLLLDNQSNVDIFCNAGMLTDIKTVKNVMRINSHGGTAITRQQGTLPGYGTVWYDPNGIANILSLSNVKRRFRVTYDSTDGDAFIVHRDNGIDKRFECADMGLYFLDMSSSGDGPPATLVTTVDKNKSMYTNRHVKAAELARTIQNRIGRPSTRDFINIVKNNLLPNCPVTVDDIKAAEHIFGPNLGSLKGKTTRRGTEHVDTTLIPIPIDIVKRYRNITLCVDVMKVNKIPFLVTVSRNIRFGTGEVLPNQKDETLLKCIAAVCSLYRHRGFNVRFIHADGQFESMRGGFAENNLHLNTAAPDEHVPEIERFIRTIKERVRSTWNILPFQQFPNIMIIYMVYSAIFWINTVPPADGISTSMSPRTIVSGLTVDYNIHCKVDFGAYAQVHEEHDNSMATRTVGAISLGTTGNAQGGCWFLSLVTGRRLHRLAWTVLPMPAEVIDRVHTIARRDKANKILTFTARDGTVIEDEDEAGVDTDDDDSD